MSQLCYITNEGNPPNNGDHIPTSSESGDFAGHSKQKK